MHGSSSRNVGLDLARSLAILLVIVQHVMFLGGLSNDGMGFAHKLQARLLEAVSQSCVDVFGILSGYLGVTAVGWRWRRFAGLYLQTWTTGLAVLCGVWAVSALGLVPLTVCGDDWLTALLPLCRDEYWYFTGYLFVFLLAPPINRWLFERTRVGPWLAAAVALAVGGVTAFPGGVDALPLHKGYSAAWLVCLYLFGAALRKAEWTRAVRSGVWFAMAAACVFVTVAQRLVMAALPMAKDLFRDEWTLHHYTSPTVVGAAGALVLGCATLRIASARIAAWTAAASSVAFGVYLIHVQPLFFASLFKGRFAFLDRLPTWAFGVSALAVSLGLFVAFAVLERGRQWVFKRVSK